MASDWSFTIDPVRLEHRDFARDASFCRDSRRAARPGRRAHSLQRIRILFTLSMLPVLVLLGCQSLGSRERNKLIFTEEEFERELLERVPGLSPELTTPPFLVHEDHVEKAEARILEIPLGADSGPDRVRALVASLSKGEPEGFGLTYHWLASTSARRTLASRQGNCVALASVLVGLGRGLGWPIYYAEARTRRPTTHEFEEVKFVSDHMVVVIAAKSFQMVVDFTGQIDSHYSVTPIDDLTAYAHLINNIAGQNIARVDGQITEKDWQTALEGFELATRIQPELGRAWNNSGIALTRLKRFDEAKIAYERAMELDAEFDSARHNLEIMQTRAQGETTVAEEPISR